jgi:HK97 family phage major capsid protein
MYKNKDIDPLEQKKVSLEAEIKTLNDGVIKFWDELGDNQPTADQKKNVADTNRKIEELENNLKETLEDIGVYKSYDSAKSRDRKARLPFTRNEVAEILSAGEAFVKSDQYNAWLKQYAPGGRLPSTRVQNSPAIDIKTLITGASSTSAGALIVNDRLPLVEQGVSYRPLIVRDIITLGTTDSDTVEYAREGSHTNNAAVIAEATATSGSTGSKPESAMALSVVTEAVKNIAHWIPASRRSIADAGQIASLINSYLIYGLDEEEEDQIVAGNGVGENFTGILNTSGVQTQAFDTSLIKTTRLARTLVKTVGRTGATAFLMHPNDWEDFDLLKDGEDRYYFGGPTVMGNPKLWGLPVVESEAVTEGTALVGNFKMAMLWDRQQAQILMSDSHSDFFTRNLIAILAEKRAAFGVLRPKAFVSIDLTA